MSSLLLVHGSVPTAKPILASLLLCLVLAAPAAADRLEPRAPHAKPLRTVVGSHDDPRSLVVKFREGTRVRKRLAGLVGSEGFDRGRLRQALAGIDPDSLQRIFARPELEIEAERVRAEQRSGRELADLNLYYRVPVPPGMDAATVCDALNALPFVELARPAAQPVAPPVDLPPTSPQIAVEQGYLAAPPHGVGALDPLIVPGADGAGVAVADVEFSWVLDHEDLELPPSAVLGGGTIDDPDDDEGSHGTAVLGIIGALPNDYGADGIAPAADIFVAPSSTVEFGFDVARAIDLATGVLGAGDVILIELQICVCSCDNGLLLGPVEWEPATFDAIQIATGLGITVIEPAGNSGLDLDSPSCLGVFDPTSRDSGAVMVGAGDGKRSRLSFSNFGSRVDVQAWGDFVATLGYGDRFDVLDVRQRYTSDFSGTSSASAIVAGVALAVQGERVARSVAPLTPAALRERLISTGVPQDVCDGPDQRIGPLPDLPAAIGVLACADGLDNDGDGLVDHPADPGCDGPDDTGEFDLPMGCSDGIDNDGDGFVDFPDDNNCSDAEDPSEFRLRPGDILLVDSVGFRDRRATGVLYRIDPVTGVRTRLFAGGAFVDPTGILRSDDGEIWIPDFSSGTLIAMPPHGEDQTVVSACFEGPWGVAAGPGNTVYVTESNLGTVVGVDKTTGQQAVVSSGLDLFSPRGIAVDADGMIVVADSGLNEILRIDAGTGGQTVVSGGLGFTNVRGLAIGPDGGYYVADFGGGAIVRVDPASGVKTFVSSAGHLVRPRNLAFDASGRIWVAEEDALDGAGAVLRIDPSIPDDGLGSNQTVIASGGEFVDPFAIVVVPEAGAATSRGIAAIALAAIAAWRRRRSGPEAQAFVPAAASGFFCRNSRA